MKKQELIQLIETIVRKQLVKEDYWSYSNSTNNPYGNSNQVATQDKVNTPNLEPVAPPILPGEKEIETQKYKDFTITIERMSAKQTAYIITSDKTGKIIKGKRLYVREKDIPYFITKIKKSIDWAEQRKLDKAELRAKVKSIQIKDHIKIGDIFYSSWGYDQTNVDFFQVVDFTNKLALVKKISEKRTATQYDAGTTIPIPNKFVSSTPIKAKLLVDGNMNVYGLKMFTGSVGSSLYRWDGKPVYWSSYA